MPAPDDPYLPFLVPLETSGLPYCVTGSVAAGIYGEYRLTADIDFVLLLRVEEIGRLRAVFSDRDYYIPPIDVLIAEANRTHRGMFNLIHNGTLFKADVFIAARDPLHRWALEHRRRVDWHGQQIWVAPPEYVIVRKLEAFREGGSQKHPRDVISMLEVTEVDRAFIEMNVERLALREQWAECQPRKE